MTVHAIDLVKQLRLQLGDEIADVTAWLYLPAVFDADEPTSFSKRGSFLSSVDTFRA